LQAAIKELLSVSVKKNITMLFGSWGHDKRTLCDCIKITQTL